MRKNSPRLQGVNAEALIFLKPRHWWRPATGDYFLLFVADSCRGLLITSASEEIPDHQTRIVWWHLFKKRNFGIRNLELQIRVSRLGLLRSYYMPSEGHMVWPKTPTRHLGAKTTGTCFLISEFASGGLVRKYTAAECLHYSKVFLRSALLVDRHFANSLLFKLEMSGIGTKFTQICHKKYRIIFWKPLRFQEAFFFVKIWISSK
jgi:hypothetical protein